MLSTYVLSAVNKTKHRIDFDEAQAWWDDLERVEIQAKKLNEPRYLVIGRISGKYWSAVITYCDDNIRLRWQYPFDFCWTVTKREIALYESV